MDFFKFNWDEAATAFEEKKPIDTKIIKKIIELTSNLSTEFKKFTDSLPREQIATLSKFISQQNNPTLIALLKQINQQVQTVTKSFEEALRTNKEKIEDIAVLKNIDEDEEEPDPYEVLQNIKNKISQMATSAQKLVIIVVPFLENNNEEPFNDELTSAQNFTNSINKAFSGFFNQMDNLLKILSEINKGNLEPEKYKSTELNEIKQSIIQQTKDLENQTSELFSEFFNTMKAIIIYAPYLPNNQSIKWLPIIDTIQKFEANINSNKQTYEDHKKDRIIKEYLEKKEFGPKQQESFDELLVEFIKEVREEIELLNIQSIKDVLKSATSAAKN